MAATADTLTATSWKTLNQKALSLAMPGVLVQRNCDVVNVYYFKPLLWDNFLHRNKNSYIFSLQKTGELTNSKLERDFFFKSNMLLEDHIVYPQKSKAL